MNQFQVAELIWENGQLFIRGLGVPDMVNRPTDVASSSPAIYGGGSGMLEEIVNQATCSHTQADEPLPCNQQVGSMQLPVTCSAHVGSCSRAVPVMDGGPHVSFNTNGSTRGEGTSMASLDNTIYGDHDYPRTSAHDHVSISLTKSREETERNKDGGDEGKRKLAVEKSSRSTKRSRDAERKRRGNINQMMKNLQEIVPNSSDKADEVSILSGAIGYIKKLEAQVHLNNIMTMPWMMLPPLMQQQLQMNTINRAAVANSPPVIPPVPTFMPAVSTPAMSDPLATVLASQSQANPMTVDAYSMLTAIYQQMQQPPPSNN